jgi:uncharacterized protein with NAD-binding domain and iron-sulfur cluster
VVRQRVAILGGGMAGLAAAWRLTRPDGPGTDVTVYQRGFRLGGKGASSRGRHGRIQEHGLHVWPGYYDNAFRLMRDCYRELDRPRHDRAAPIQVFEDAFFPASTIGLLGAEATEPWVANFPENQLAPGHGPVLPLDPGELLQRGAGLLGSLTESLVGPGLPARAHLSVSRYPPARPPRPALPGPVTPALGSAPLARGFLELVGAIMRGIILDMLPTRGYTAIDDLDFCEWLRRHGASPAALGSPLVRGMYDLVFGYEGGDRRRPRFSAGTGLHLAGRMFLTYRGAMFWKMRAGMGDVVFAPLYEVLRRRGVRFAFFHRIDRLVLSRDRKSVQSIVLGRQATLSARHGQYDPLVSVGGLPVFPDRADGRQLATATRLRVDDLEGHTGRPIDGGGERLEAGRDYDAVVLAVPPAMIEKVGTELIAADSRWHEMVEQVASVATHSAQLWVEEDERSLGWPHRAALVSGFGQPFDTFASMSHTLPFEAWPAGRRPRTAASLCGVLPEGPPNNRRRARRPFPAAALARLWPAYQSTQLISWYYRANTDPSDRYVVALPGSGRYRLPADGSGFSNLFLAGDWIDSGLNAGCIEAAALSGLQAANAVEGRTVTEGTVGFAPHRLLRAETRT